MKNKILIYTLIISLSSLTGKAQSNYLNNKKLDQTKTIYSPINVSNDASIIGHIKYYHVEEIVSSKFGGYKTTYNVGNPKTIRTYDLGINGKRTITPVYANENELTKIESVNKPNNLSNINNQKKTSITNVTENKDSSYAYIDVIKTYEKVTAKGYESVNMLKKLGDSYFVNKEFEKADKCYNRLFQITTDLEPYYYYRYSIVLKSIGNTQKSEEYSKKFSLLSGTANR